MTPNGDIASKVNHQDWIEKIKTELKTSDLSGYDYVWDGERISPFEDLKPIRRLLSHKKDNEWSIGAELECTDGEINKKILSVLHLGASAIKLNIDRLLPWKKVFTGVHLDWIHTEFSLIEPAIWHDLNQYLRTVHDAERIKGICWVHENNQQELFKLFQAQLPGLRCLTFQVNVADTSDAIAFNLGNLLNRITVLSRTYDRDTLLSQVAIRFIGGEDLVLNISMLRACRLLWMQSLSATGLNVYSGYIPISGKVPLLHSTPGDQMISASLIATSMILGGVDVLFIADADPVNSGSRWGLMTQHILREEAMLNKVNDPLAGGLVIERLTQVIANKIWDRYLSLK